MTENNTVPEDKMTVKENTCNTVCVRVTENGEDKADGLQAVVKLRMYKRKTCKQIYDFLLIHFTVF